MGNVFSAQQVPPAQQMPKLDPHKLVMFPDMPHMSLNCWYFGASVPLADDYIVVCSRSCGPSDYAAEWRFFPDQRRFELVVMDYWTGAHPKKIAECRAFYQVLTYIVRNRHPHDISGPSGERPSQLPDPPVASP